MPAHNDPFFPHRVDESVEQFASPNPFDNVADAQPSIDVNERLVHDMQQLYSLERKRYQRALQRVEERLVAHYTTSSQPRSVSSRTSGEGARRAPEQIRQGRFYQMEKRQRSKFGRRVGLLVAALVMLVLVGSMLLVLNATRQTAAQPSGTTLGSSTGAHFGQTIYTTPSSSAGFQELSWSPDSKRIASLTDNVQVWDATTGAHRMTVHLPTGSWPYALAWSPNSQLIAIGTSKSLILADGQSGAIVHTFAVNTSANTQNSGSNSFLSTFSPLGGGLGVRAVAWSPDGHSLAFSISHGATGGLEVVNAQTGAQDYTLPVTGNYVVDALAWSSDGKYLAGNVFNTQPGAQTVPADEIQMVWAWNVSSRQVIFKKAGGNGTGDPIAWQPGSDNLAFLIWVPGKGGATTSAIGLWNVATNTLVKQYAAAAFGPVAWSPDGKYLAYGGGTTQSNTSSVGILDASSGEQVYTYKQMHIHVGALAWSPNGKYIVSGEGNSIGNMVAKVWTAE
jgi:WD40 repeat protein